MSWLQNDRPGPGRNGSWMDQMSYDGRVPVAVVTLSKERDVSSLFKCGTPAVKSRDTKLFFSPSLLDDIVTLHSIKLQHKYITLEII